MAIVNRAAQDVTIENVIVARRDLELFAQRRLVVDKLNPRLYAARLRRRQRIPQCRRRCT